MANRQEKVPYTDIFNPGAQVMPKMMMVMARTHGRLASTYLETGIEMLEFLKKRFREDRKLIEQVTEAEGPDEMMNSFLDFWQTAYSSYSEEMAKLMLANTTMASDAAEEINREIEIAADNAGPRKAA